MNSSTVNYNAWTDPAFTADWNISSFCAACHDTRQWECKVMLNVK